MNNGPQSACEILYVDDEELALKYFRMAFAGKYTIHTASSAKAGLEILRNSTHRIGIVVSDQRMPEILGAEFLGIVREEFPQIVRILTTAYSDLESAIQAVNRGHIYQYVVKPWEVKDFGMILQRAADYHHVLSERNRLLALKMNTLQRILCGDRLLWLLLFKPGGELESAYIRTLRAYIQALPAPAFPSAEFHQAVQFEAGTVLRSEYDNAEACLTALRSLTGPESARPALTEYLSDFSKQLALQYDSSTACDIAISDDAAPSIKLTLPSGLPTDALVHELFGLLLSRKTSALSLAFFKVLVAAAALKGSVTVLVRDDAAPQEFVFSVGDESSVERGELVDILYQRISVWDVTLR